MVNAHKNKAMIIILSAPSGGGKSSIAEQLLLQDSRLVLSVSATTRPARSSEKDSVHYFFKSKEEFHKMMHSGEFLEYAEIYDNMYGTPSLYVKDMLDKGRDILFDIDSQGAYQIIKQMQDRVVSIFITPPDIETLQARLESRGQDSNEVIANRIKLAEEEISHAKNYDYIVINDDFNKAIAEIQQIIKQERIKRNIDAEK